MMLPCPLHYFTGLDCPLCGMQRAIVAIFHGNIFEAFMLNPVAWCLMPYFVLATTCSFNSTIKKSTIGVWSMKNSTIFSVIGILAIWGIIRNIIQL